MTLFKRKIRQNRYIPMDSNHQPPLSSKQTVKYCIAIAFGFILGSQVMSSPMDLSPSPVKQDCFQCHYDTRKTKFIEYFKRSGNKHPEKMAEAVLATKQPKLLAAVAVAGENNTPYTVRKGGYKKQHAGAWQVNPKYWGKVPHDPVLQAKQAEQILLELIEEKPLKIALSIYGGDSTSKYASRVLDELKEVP